MELTAEDGLRLHVLLARRPLAIRVEPDALELRALTDAGELAMALHPSGSVEAYLRVVRERLSDHALGTPHGYPVFLREWTRTGQARDQSLHKLLLLGEPEATTAVVHASGLTPDLARYAWWAAPDADHARTMLRNAAVADSPVGEQMRGYLLEFLPFEQASVEVIESVRVIVSHASDELREQLWQRAHRRPAYLAGFLAAGAHALPLSASATSHPLLDDAAVNGELSRLAAHNWFAAALCGALSPTGRTFLHTLHRAIERAADQDTVISLVDSLERYFEDSRGASPTARSGADLAAVVYEAMDSTAARELGASMPDAAGAHALIRALATVTNVGEPMLAEIFGRTDAVGSVMRKRLEPMTGPLGEAIACLCS